VVLVRRGDDGERLAGASFGDGGAGCLRQRPSQERVDAAQAFGRDRQGAVCACSADDAAGAGREAGDRFVRPTLGTAAGVRQVAGEPEQLELEREAERLELRPRSRFAVRRVQYVEEADNGRKDALVSLLVGEQAKHRLGPDQAHGEPVRAFADRGMWPHERGSGHRRQLAAALVEQ
jgi:hypothetical protein